VFQRPGYLGSTYCLYTDGVRIGYAQWSRIAVGVSTIHKPNQRTGTGFWYADVLTEETLKGALNCIAPDWAYATDRASVKKYRDFNEYLSESKFNRKLVEV
jgi:hypothetical protein